MKKSKQKLADNFVDYVFRKNPELEWKEDEKGLVILMRPNKGLTNRIFQKLFHKPKISQIHMEEMGSFIWKQLDGEKSVLALGEQVREHFGEKAEPLYERLSVYVKMLEDYGFAVRVK